MAYRGRDTKEMAGTSSFRCIEVMLLTGSVDTEPVSASEVLVVDNHWDTLRFVQENMDLFVGNMVKLRKVEPERRTEVDVSARLFQRQLQPFFVLISAMAKEHVLDKLSGSLKKALLLMAMDRYNCDRDSMCRALGLTRMKLDREMARCGLLPKDGKRGGLDQE